MKSYGIGELARLAGVPTSTVRFYERIGLVKPDFRTGGNYRGYTQATLKRLQFVRSAQASGLCLDDIEAIFNLAGAEEPPCAEVLSLMRRRLEEIRERIREQRQIEKVLAESLERCCKGNERDLCAEVCNLSRTHSIGCKPPRKKDQKCA